jgi:hypothetical protein
MSILEGDSLAKGRSFVTRVRIPLGSPFDSAFIKASLMTALRAPESNVLSERERVEGIH